MSSIAFARFSLVPRSWILLLGGAILLVILIGLTIFPLWIVVLGCLGAVILVYCLADASRSILLFVVITESMLFKEDPGVTTSAEVVAGIVLGAIAFWWIVRIKILERGQLIESPLHLTIGLYFAWALTVSVLGMAIYGDTLNNVAREFSLQIPLLILPILYVRFIKPGSPEERQLFLSLIGIWILVVLAGYYRFQHGVLHSVYLYQTGRLAADLSASMLLVLIGVTLLMHVRSKYTKAGLIITIGIGIMGVILGLYRTLYVATIVASVLLYLLSQKSERKRGRPSFYMLGFLAIAASVIAYFKIRLVRVFAAALFVRFTSTSHLSTDPSLVNRYIEWTYILKTIAKNPLVGKGYGGAYFSYNWLGGAHFNSTYSHNGYYYILLKSGAIGLFLFLIGYIGLFVRSYILQRNRLLPDIDRAFLRICFAFLATTFITTLTLNVFADRPASTCIGLAWAFIISREKLARETSANSLGALQEPSISPVLHM